MRRDTEQIILRRIACEAYPPSVSEIAQRERIPARTVRRHVYRLLKADTLSECRVPAQTRRARFYLSVEKRAA